MDKSKLSDEEWVQLGVWSRDEVTRVGFKYSRIFLPRLNKSLVRRFPSQRFEVLGKVKGTHKGQHMRFQALQVKVMKGALMVASLMVRFMRSACPFVHG